VYNENIEVIVTLGKIYDNTIKLEYVEVNT